MINLPQSSNRERLVVVEYEDDGRLGIEYRDVETGKVNWAKLLPVIHPPIKLTQEQTRYLFLGPDINGEIRLQGPLSILRSNEQGWILVGNLDDPDNWWSSGVWVDEKGHEHYGGGG